MALPTAAATASAGTSWNRALVEVVDIGSLSLSPDGRTLLFRTEKADLAANDHDLDWYRLDARTGRAQRVGSAGDAVIDDPGVLRSEAPLWLADGRAAVRMFVDGAIGVWIYSPESGQFAPLITGDANVEKLRVGEDGVSLVYELGPSRAAIRRAEEQERDVGVLIDPTVDLAQGLFRGGSVDGRKASQRLTGYWYMREGLLARAPRQTRRWDARTGVDTAIGAAKTPEPFQPPAIDAVASIRAPDGGEANAFWSGREGRLEWRPKKGPPVRCDAAVCHTKRVASLAWRRVGRELLVSLTDRYLRQSLAIWDLARSRFRLVAQSDGSLGGSRRGYEPCAVAERAAFCVEAGPASPPRLIRVDLGTGTKVPLFDPNAALRSRYRATVERIELLLASGVPVAATVLTPAGATLGDAPLFINYYRCEGFLRGGEGDEWPIPALLEAGFAVACVNAAPITGAQDAVKTYENGLEAVGRLVDRLAARGLVDRRRVAMGGFSFGSEVAMWTAMKSDLLAAVSIASGQPEPTDYWYGAILGAAHDRVTREVWGLGPPDETPARWSLVSPAKNVKAIRAAILFQLPEQEARRIPELFVRLRNAGRSVELWAYPDEAHLKTEPRHRLAAYERNLDWFRYWLQGIRDPDPGKAAQYRRWEALAAGGSSGQAEAAAAP